MEASGGTGLAAPQIGESIRVVIYRVSPTRAQSEGSVEVPLRLIVNPVITPTASECVKDWEGCLSVPGLRGRVPRPLSVNYEYIDGFTGEHVTGSASGFHARVLLHETDHLDGVLYL